MNAEAATASAVALAKAEERKGKCNLTLRPSRPLRSKVFLDKSDNAPSGAQRRDGLKRSFTGESMQKRLTQMVSCAG